MVFTALPKRLTWDQEFNFWSKVDRRSENECWCWTGGKKTNGDYVVGMVTINGKKYICARVSYLLAYGDPGSFQVLHTCDNELCLNPGHLYRGTQSDNMRDRHASGKTFSKLSLEDAREIRQSKLSVPKLASKFNVCEKTVQRVILGTIWKEPHAHS